MLTSSRGTSNEVRPLRSESGFTLLEIVLVVLVLALLVGIAVPRLPDVAGTRIWKDARKVSMMLQLGRLRAVSLRRYYGVEVDLDSNTVALSYFGPEGKYIPDDEVRTVSLSEAYLTDVVNSTDGKILEGTGRVRISPRGFFEPALIHLRDDHDRTLTINPLPASGRVRILDGYTELAAR